MEEKLAQRPSSCLKIVLFGPESTGKTTLAKQLATHYNTCWVEEYMREYLQKKWDKRQQTCTPEDLPPIARGQMALENKRARQANKFLFCDTNLLELKVYSEAYYEGFCDANIAKYALKNDYSLYFLTYIDIPWTEDDLRDKPEDRMGMFQRFQQALEISNKPYTILKGNEKERLTTAIATINNHLKKITK